MVLVVLVAVVTSYFLVPFFIDQEYFNTGVSIKQGIMDSFGHSKILAALVGGNIFDYGRFPSLSILTFFGLAICLFGICLGTYVSYEVGALVHSCL